MEYDLDTVMKKIRQVFPERDANEILACLEGYGTESFERERYRVFLAILKLCDEEKLSDPSHYVEAAKQDYRDVLAWAQYPNQMKFAEPGKSAQFVKLDEEQYRAWLDKA